MKNFKRVISAVIALALSTSTLVASVSATKFDDVADSAPYAEAVNVLSSLGVVHGYEDGSFQPEGDITRAEAVTMIVGGVNLTAEAQAAAGSTKFTDVNEQASWASGYVNVGVQQGFINGMDDTHFAPQEKVTYAQMCVMLTSITGYAEYAKEAGGWPTGYVSMANQAKITEGVILENNTPLKRGQVAKMLYNAMRAYELGVVEYSFNGNTYAPLNGSEKSGNKFSTILYDKFSGYTLKVQVQGTSKTLDMKSGRARLFIDSADWWGGQSGGPVKAASSSNATDSDKDSNKGRLIDVILDDVSVDDYLFQYGTAIVIVDDLDQNHLVHFTPNTRVDTKTLRAVDYEKPTADGKGSVDGQGTIRFDGRDTSVNKKLKIVVNGYVINLDKTPKKTVDAALEAIMPYALGDVILVDNETQDPGYDSIFITAYDVAKVVSVSTSNGQTTVSLGSLKGFDKDLGADVRSIVVSKEKIEKEETKLTVKNADGDELDITNIKKDDIIAFATQPLSANAGKISDPTEIDIIVTDETFTGKVTASDDTDKTFTIDGTDYEMTKWDESIMQIPNTYTIVLDPFGRIFDADVEKTTAKYAIAEEWNKSDGLQLILPSGSYKWYDLVSQPSITINKVEGKSTTDLQTYLGANLTEPTKRIVKYTLRASTGEVATVEVVGGAAVSGEYKATTEKLGYTIVDGTAVINAQNYVNNGANARPSDYSVYPISSFVDKGEYKYFAVAMEGTTNAEFIVLTEASKDITSNSRFAVVKKKPSATQTPDGDDVWSMTVLYGGIEQDFYFERLDTNKPALEVGDAFYFVKNSDGVIETGKYEKIFTKSTTTATTAFTKLSFQAGKWGFDYDKENTEQDIQLIYGVVSNVRGSSTIEFAQIENTTTSYKKGEKKVAGVPAAIIDRNSNYKHDYKNNIITPGVKVFGISSDCEAYRIVLSDADGSKRESDAVTVTSPTGFAVSQLDSRYEIGIAEDGTSTTTKGTKIYNLYAELEEKVDWTQATVAVPTFGSEDKTGYDYLTYALAMVVDDQIVEIYAVEQ